MADFFKKQNSSDKSPELSIHCRQGEYAGVAFPLKAGDTISIGKNPEISNIVLSDPGISRLHCTITYVWLQTIIITHTFIMIIPQFHTIVILCLILSW